MAVIFDTPLYRESVALQQRQAAELTAALKDCRSERDRSSCIQAYARLHWAEQDCLGQRHGRPPMLWPADGMGLPHYG